MASNCYATSGQLAFQKGKLLNRHYVNAKLIRATDEGLFFRKNGKNIPIKSVHVDLEGKLYVKTAMIAKGYCPKHKDWGFARMDGKPSCKKCRDEKKK